MRAGKLDRAITIERATQPVAASGAVSATWPPVATVRAEIVNQSTAEFLAGYGEGERATIVFRIRYLAGITTADRITFDGSHYNLREIVEIGRRRGLELRAEIVR